MVCHWCPRTAWYAEPHIQTRVMIGACPAHRDHLIPYTRARNSRAEARAQGVEATRQIVLSNRRKTVSNRALSKDRELQRAHRAKD